MAFDGHKQRLAGLSDDKHFANQIFKRFPKYTFAYGTLFEKENILCLFVA